MKIQINGFDIEVNTEESNMTIKVLDANGKELSNNTFTQSAQQDDSVTNVQMPAVQDDGAQNVQPNTDAQVQTDNTQPVQNDVVESYIPDFKDFLKLKKEGKL